MSRKNGKGTMIRKPYWGVLASILLAIAFLAGCSMTPATITPGAVTTVTANNPFQQNTVINSPFASTLSVTVTTAGTPVVGATVTFSAPGAGAGGNFGGSTTATGTTDSTGLATSPTFTANGTVGTYNVIASVASTTSTALFNMANTRQPVPISVSGGTPQSTSIGTQFASTLSVTVKDASGNSVGANLPVLFTAPAFAAPDGYFVDTHADTTTALTNASGVATSAPYVASGTVSGLYSVTACLETPLGVCGLDGDMATATFTLSNTIMPATNTATSGTPQSTISGTPFATPLAVTVLDGSTPPVPVANALVTFTAPAFTVNGSGVDSTSSGTFAGTGTVTTNVWTNGSGVATAPTFTANTLPGGPYTVSATVVVKSGTTLTANFSLTNQ